MCKLFRVIAILLMFLCVFGVAACGSDDTVELPEWEKTDLNGDGTIDNADYDIWKKYYLWKNSEDAEDYNGDRKIDYSDYEICLKYYEWKNSSDAEDLNGDRKIDYSDYEIFSNPELVGYAQWAESEDSYDYDKNGRITAADYNIYIQRKDVIGEYLVTDFHYSPNVFLSSDNSLSLNDIDDITDDVTLSVNKDLKVTSSYGVRTKTVLGANEEIVKAAVESCNIVILSKNAISATFTIADSGVNVFTVYFEKGNGESVAFTARINVTIDGQAVAISFNLICV